MNTNSRIKKVMLTFLFVSLLISPVICEADSSKKAFLKSLLIPGWGELSQGNATGYIFIATEVLNWSGKFYFYHQEDLKSQQAKQYALRYANINPANIDDEYLNLLSDYDHSSFNTGGYNASIYNKAMADENLTDEQKQLYITENIISDDESWNWESYKHRSTYSGYREDAASYEDLAKALTGTIIANHIISAINSLRISRKNKVNMSLYFTDEMNPYFSCSYGF